MLIDLNIINWFLCFLCRQTSFVRNWASVQRSPYKVGRSMDQYLWFSPTITPNALDLRRLSLTARMRIFLMNLITVQLMKVLA